MIKYIYSFLFLACFCTMLVGQIETKKMGKGIQFLGSDSTFLTKMNVRIQNQAHSTWNINTPNGDKFDQASSGFLVRRIRLKFGGWAYTSKMKYKLQLGLGNRDITGGFGSQYGRTAIIILDAYFDWNFYKGFSLRFGQGKPPGNRETIISSGDLQFVDRSNLTSKFTLDRDMGLLLSHKHTVFGGILLREIVSMSSGEGRNVTIGNLGGYQYTFRLEALPFGAFSSNGDYKGSDTKKESSPKLALGFSYDINNKAARERGNKGRFIVPSIFISKTLTSFYADLMFKYKGFSTMIEYVDRKIEGGNPIAYFRGIELDEIGRYYIGSAINIQSGYIFLNNYEISARYTNVLPDYRVGENETLYTLGFSKYVVGHKLKVQTDLTYRVLDNLDAIDQLIWRTQVELQF